ncbi:MAG: hypothetical protein KAQ83_02125 [Nanoarchaeota archaeon]|nr:hypothetical protein [Nanoarchaeota archaeon]
MKIIYLSLITLLLFSNICFAADFASVDDVKLDLDEFIEVDCILVFGHDLSKVERTSLKFLDTIYPDIATVESINATDYNISINKIPILIGGPNQNELTQEILDKMVNITERELSFGILLFGTDNEGKKYVIFSDKAGLENVKKNLERSPLAKIIPIKFIPAAATGIGISLMWLWKFLFKFFYRAFRLTASSKIMRYVKKKKFKNEYKGFKFKGVRIKYREWFSILGAAAIFALASAYSFYSKDFKTLVYVSFFVNCIIYAIRHITRLVMDKRYSHHTEYVFWIWGGLITIISGWLGNTFCLAGYTLSESETKKGAKISYNINLWSFLASIIFLIINFVFPSKFMQMAVILCMSLAVIQMMPFKPFSGKNIYKWNLKKWYFTAIPMFMVYFLVSIWV